MRPSCVAAVLTLWLQAGLAYYAFQQEIPNGDHVPHPCKVNYVWHGVGHKVAQGGGERNPFGQDFEANGKVWNETLCRKDSDGDGRTNGQELGDPDCVWKKGQTPPTTHNLSHPGVCDPYDADFCSTKNSWLDCSLDDFNCEYINDPEVLNITVRIPRTKVPAQQTTYMCFNFDFPSDDVYHLIATQPFIDNKNVLHHLTLFGCVSEDPIFNQPAECMMGNDQCRLLLGGWTLGMTGQCFDSQAGFRMGIGGSTKTLLQLHWTNPDKVDTWFDSSGFILYYTTKLRQYNAGGLLIGQSSISIPPGESAWLHQGVCSSHCTEQILQGTIQIMTAENHMHYRGIRQNVTLKRSEGSTLMVLADDNPYSYDNPKTHMFSPAIPMYPGDELTTICTFQSRSLSKTTLYGEGTFDEMCFAFLNFFPAENVTNQYCLQWEDIDACDMGSKCDNSIFNISNPVTIAVIDKIMENCDPAGNCRYECPAAIAEVREESPCIKNIWRKIRYEIYTSSQEAKLLRFAAAMDSCGGPDALATTTTAAKPQEADARGVRKVTLGSVNDEDLPVSRLWSNGGDRHVDRGGMSGHLLEYITSADYCWRMACSLHPLCLFGSIERDGFRTSIKGPSRLASGNSSLHLNLTKQPDFRPLLQNVDMNNNYNSDDRHGLSQ